MPLTFEIALAQIERREAVRKAAHEAERRRQELSGYGVDLAPLRLKTDAEKRSEAEAAVAAHNSPDAVLKRQLIAAAEANIPGAYGVLTAADRGEADWQDRARTVVSYARAA